MAEYPSKAIIRRAIEAARQNGVDVAGVELRPDGSIKVMDARLSEARAPNLFDQLEAAGKL